MMAGSGFSKGKLEWAFFSQEMLSFNVAGDRAAMRDGPGLGHSRAGIRPAALQARFLPLKKETREIAAFHRFGDTLTTSGLPEAVSRKDNIGPPSVAPVEKYIAKL